ncbi:MAG: protein kinase [Cyanobacteria bacterium TGS_CYA1]|nr:protein kinase [Cyanobacteria bacterium TGS_CYA1]
MMNSITAETTNNSVIRLLIAEDHEVVRLGLKLSLQGFDDLQVVGEAASGTDVLDKAARLKPDVIVMDVGLPGMDGISATNQIKKLSNSKVLILSSHTDENTIMAAFKAGADGYCVKDSAVESVRQAIHKVAEGGTWLADDLALKAFKLVNTKQFAETKRYSILPDNELEILNLIMEGASVQEIAANYSMSEMDVYSYMTQVLHRVAQGKSSVDSGPHTKKYSGEHELARICTDCSTPQTSFSDRCTECGGTTKPNELIGSIFADRYEILSLLGAGAGGSVYKARHRFMKNLVAIKILHASHMQEIQLMQRFSLEAQALSKLKHPNITTITDFGITSNGSAFMIMDYFEAVSLSKIIDEYGFLSIEQVIPIFKQICDGLQFAHDQGVIHRDLKPNNVLVSNFGKPDMVVKIADFGTVKLCKPLVNNNVVATEMGQVFGSPLYMSPEQCRGDELDYRSDIYSMGCLMYECLIGLPPIVGKSVIEVMYKHMHEECPHIGDTEQGSLLNDFCQGLVMKALQKNKDQRFKSMQELKTYLEGVVLD